MNKRKDIISLWIRRALGESRRRIVYYLDVDGLEDVQLGKIQSITPDQIVYCKPETVSIEGGKNLNQVKENISVLISNYMKRKGYEPKVVIIEGLGIFGIGENLLSAKNCAYTFWDTARVVKASKSFGGPHFLSKKQTDFIDNWEVEAYRRKTGKTQNKLEGRIAIVTGAAQGVGFGIAENLVKEGVHVVIADINYNLAQKKARELEIKYGESKALPCKVDVTKEKEVEKMVEFAIGKFGGIDIFISNAGILTAGNIFELSCEKFNKVMGINCNAYFLCAKKAAEVMKEQGYGDIIQINSKSGKRGSKANSAYAASKFAGIGLTQSIAMDLAPYNIFVNAICPGNFLDLELWQDKGGLLDQYLSSGKVPAAKTKKDVEEYYKNLTLLKRGCTIEDIMRTIFYILEQRGETGQAYNVTQGQEMR